MDPTKAWYKSRSIWGSFVMLASLVLEQSGAIKLTDTDQQEIVNTILTALEGVGGVAALWGRLVAKHKLATKTRKAA